MSVLFAVVLLVVLVRGVPHFVGKGRSPLRVAADDTLRQGLTADGWRHRRGADGRGDTWERDLDGRMVLREGGTQGFEPAQLEVEALPDDLTVTADAQGEAAIVQGVPLPLELVLTADALPAVQRHLATNGWIARGWVGKTLHGVRTGNLLQMEIAGCRAVAGVLRRERIDWDAAIERTWRAGRPEVRRAALELALRRQGDRAPALVDSLLHDPDDAVRILAAEVARRADVLLAVLRGTRDDDVLFAASVALRGVGVPPGTFLADRARHGAPPWRGLVLAVLDARERVASETLAARVADGADIPNALGAWEALRAGDVDGQPALAARLRSTSTPLVGTVWLTLIADEGGASVLDALATRLAHDLPPAERAALDDAARRIRVRLGLAQDGELSLAPAAGGELSLAAEGGGLSAPDAPQPRS